jgi:hypothetical protein
MAVPTGRESDKFMLRLPDGMRDRIRAAAEANSRSMNAEIVATLEEKYPAPVLLDDAVAFDRAIKILKAATTMAEFRERVSVANEILQSSRAYRDWSIKVPRGDGPAPPKDIQLFVGRQKADETDERPDQAKD